MKNHSMKHAVRISKRNTTRKVMISVIIVLVGLIFASLVYFAQMDKKPADVIDNTGTDVIEEPVTKDSSMPEELRNEWLANKEINSDYIGNIIFDSGLINVPFVQAKDVYKENGEMYVFYTEEGQLVTDPTNYNGNDVYIWTNWKTGKWDKYDEGGSCFMDYANTINDQNIIIYGHHFARDWDPSGSKQFTPLDLLLEQENYEANRSLKLILDNEIREYIVTNVFIININNEYNTELLRTDMNVDFDGNPDPGFFEEYIEYMNSISEYDSGEHLSKDDRILSLITCIQHQPELRQIIICKETSVTKYTNS